MIALRLLLALTLATAVSLLGASGAAAQGAGDSQVLLFHGGTSHPSVDAGIAAISDLGDANDFEVDATDDPGAFTAANLDGYRAVVVLHSSGDVLSSAQQSALQSYVQGGGGFVGIGEAANLQPGVSFFSGLIGARPAGASSDAVTAQVVEVGDRVHPATRELPLEWGPRSDAWYQWQQNPTGQVHTVARARFGATADDGFRSASTSRPISWCRDFQGGRSFYTGMGRTAASYSEENFQEHLLGAIQWAAGMVRGGCKATIASNYQSVRLSNGQGGLANSGESHGVSVAPNGWAITIARADCTSNAERGARIGTGSFSRTLNFNSPNVGVGCAPIHIWDPEEHDGTVNSGVTRAGTLTVYGDRGSGGEVNGKIETGGLGITVAPDFMQTGHIYVQYFPSFNAENPVHPGLQDGAERRITKMGVGRISRFTIDLETKELDLGTEVPIFEYDSQIYSCCHRGGGMGFDSEGNLYVTTGDSNSSGGGYSGNWQNVRCPTGDPTAAVNAHCGDNNISYRDARRTAGNTNDYNGKMLRINPVDDIADGEEVEIGVGSTYTLPDADSPNGPNLFDGTEGDGGLAKPEIYAMGLRNPSRLSIDPETDTPYSAWVGPDAGSPSSTQGPSTYEVASQIPRAGNWGWPYCMGDKQAYRDRLPDNSLRGTNAAGYVTGGSAGSPTQGWYDCDNLVNDSSNNTGLTVLPHETGTGQDAGAVRPANLWYSRGNPGGQGCPTFPRPNGPDSAPNYGATNTQLCPYYDGLGGWTVMNGPVYRYDDEAGDDSVRWPEYWDGRWFVHDFSGGNAKSFGFLMDDTAAEGGQPAYVDKMSQYVNWSGGAYMDSKYGPDGALYLQSYDGNYFFQGNNDGLHRVTYTGGPDTPGPDPQWEGAGGGQVAFSIGRSGGIAYEWDFGDGSPASDEASPTHTYEGPGSYDVTLTVTYADGDEASRTIEVIVSDDETPPVTTHALDPDEPGAGGSYDGPVEVTLSATDPADGGAAAAAENHDVNARPSAWAPDELDIALGDEVTWNFPSDAGPPHDVWLIEPGEAPDSQGFQVTDGPVSAGGPPVSYTFEEAGSWTFLCKLHSFVSEGEWTGMVGTVDVAEDSGGGEASGVEFTEYRVNTDGATGELQRSDNDDEVDPFETTFTVSEPGDHEVVYRSRDRAGNVEEAKSVEFTIEAEEPPPSGGTCLPQSDEFDGDALDSKWDVLRPAGVGPQVADGSLSLEIRQGDFIANNTLAQNALLQDAPDGEWTVTTKLNTSAINANGEQAGLVIWKSESPNTFSKLVAIQSNAGIHQFEHIVTQNGSVNPSIPQSITPAPGGQLPAEVLLRARYTGSQVIGEFSGDNGETWTRVGQEGHAAPFTGEMRIGLAAFRGNNGGGFATFDWFRTHPGSEAGGPIGCAAPGCYPLSDQFDGQDLDSKWEIVNPDSNNPPTVGDGHLTLPIIPGDLFGGNGSAQMLLQQAPEDSWVATAKIAHANIDANGEAAGLALVNSFNPNHFVKTAVQFKSDADPDTPGNQPGKWAERVLTANNQAVTIPPDTVQWPNSGALNLTGDYVWVRFVHDAQAQEVTTWTSTNGTTFTRFGAAMPVDEYLSQPGGLRVGLFAKRDNTANDEVDIDAFNVVAGTTDPQTPGDDCGAPVGQCPHDDEFDGDELDSKWEVVNPNPDALSVGDGHLTLTTAPGDVFGANFTAQNTLLQAVPEGPWTATAKLDHTAIAVDGQAAGVVIYGQQNPNHFAKTAIQYKNVWQGDPVNGIWVERILTTNNALNGDYGGQFPNSGKIEPPTDYVWIRVSYDGEDVITEYSLDGESWAEQAPPVPADEYGAGGVTKIGLFVKHDGSGPEADVDFDSFTVEAESCGGAEDSTPPTTTHALDPESPDGAGGWYVSPVEVTLDATDNEGGSGVELTEYRFAGDEDWTEYDGPFTVSDDGRHQVEYRSTDAAGNTETTRSVSFRIDATDPTTTALLDDEEPVSNYDGPVDVRLQADDGDGSGVRVTEIRVDGGDWQPYVEEEVILDSEEDLEAWEQAGPGGLNWVDQEGGFARTFGGLGMPWYPKEYGDFSVKMQWRDSGSGSNGNSGVFVRFPHPVDTAARPPAERYPCQVGSAQSSPAWVAIYCGHEIQINDHQASEPQKTGSVYNFSPLNATQAMVQPKGTWVDYEVRVEGQTYTMVRNGEVLQEWENAPDQNSSRAGDPPTNDRQFASGYIGLQNHGGNDVIDFRDVRVLPLDEGSVQGPITIEGDGEHTVEYRSTDVAGNEEDVQEVTFTIGEDEEDTTPPVTTHSLDPEDPGEGGTYDRPVDVTLSATDAEAGEAANHDVNATPSAWQPDELDVALGDQVTWNFPSTAGPPHDVWLIEPGEAPDSQGFEVTDGPVSAGGDPVSYTLDEAGSWTFVCKLHSFVSGGEWTGMVGTADVAGGSGSGSGVEFTEYRVNTDGATGDWVQSDNDAGDDPFETAFTVSDEGDHEVEYRSTDNAGNEEETKSVEFSITEEDPGDPDAPSVQGFADPSSGTAPLRVQFSATGLDPQGGRLTYEWRFGDGSGSFNQSPRHTYTEPGTYTATVIATDPQGKTGTDTVEIVVTEQGNEAPTVAAAADPVSGVAPLQVRFSAQATDPDGPHNQITYLWDFDDEGSNAFGRNARHTYMEPGTYTATVTATDRHGAFDTAEVTVVVGNPPGNQAPTVQAAATPRSGTAPLRVRFTSAATDPDGDPVSTVWSFGDGVQAGGPNITHTYAQPGTYTATVTVTDPGGLTDSDSVQITVRGATGVASPPFGAPPPFTPPFTAPPEQSQGDVAGEAESRPLVRAPKARKVRRVTRRGLRLKVSCADTCRAKSILRINGQRIGKSKKVRIRADRTRTVVIRLNRNVRRNLLAAMRQSGVRRLKATAVTKIATADDKRKVRDRVNLKR